MIDITVIGIKSMKNVTQDNLLSELHNYLDRTKFFGTINLKYEAGVLKYVKCEETFTVDSLIQHLSQ
ncbi:MAG TPA: hypothetical protein VF974_08185 [Patescibacteria group bacterium]